MSSRIASIAELMPRIATALSFRLSSSLKPLVHFEACVFGSHDPYPGTLDRLSNHRSRKAVRTPIIIDSRDALNTRIAQSDFLVVYAMTPWSGPCRMMTVSINTLATDYIGRATFAQVNLEAVPAIAEQFGIATVPTLLFFKKNRLVHTVIGLRTQAEIANELEEFL